MEPEDRARLEFIEAFAPRRHDLTPVIDVCTQVVGNNRPFRSLRNGPTFDASLIVGAATQYGFVDGDFVFAAMAALLDKSGVKWCAIADCQSIACEGAVRETCNNPNRLVNMSSDVEYIFVPLHAKSTLTGEYNHFALGAISLTTNKVFVYDTLKGYEYHPNKNITMLRNQLCSKENQVDTIELKKKRVPIQQQGNSCGLQVIKRFSHLINKEGEKDKIHKPLGCGQVFDEGIDTVSAFRVEMILLILENSTPVESSVENGGVIQ